MGIGLVVSDMDYAMKNNERKTKMQALTKEFYENCFA